ncbi:MAG: CoA-binding protein [Planctomycetota bacterium]|nr:CoA-binding protein [Planctomycetota bacterium]
MEKEIAKFLAASSFAVAGASTNQQKYGNQIFRALVTSGRTVYPLNPFAEQINGIAAYASIADLPEVPESVSIVTPPAVTRQVVADAIRCGVQHVWVQPGATDSESSESARRAGLTVIDNGSCVLVLLARK